MKRDKSNFKNEIGNTFGKLTVLERVENHHTGTAKWLCICECGNKTKVLGTSLRNGKTKSCGCSIGNERSGNAVFNILFRSSLRHFKNTNLEFNIDLEFIKSIVFNNCTYCNREPYELKCAHQRLRKSKGLEFDECLLIQGLDRVDSNKGYTKDNVVPCCKYCNRAKSDLTTKEFKKLITLIFENYVKTDN